MRNKLLLIVFLLWSGFAGAQVTEQSTQTIINANVKSPISVTGVKTAITAVNDFASKGDSIARTKESFISPGSSSSYLNGLKQWIAAGSITGLSWSGITTGKPTTISGYGITDGLTAASAPTVTGLWNFTTRPTISGETILTNTNTVTATNKTFTAATVNGLYLGGITQIGAFNFYPITNNTANIGQAGNYFSGIYSLRNYFNSGAYIDGAAASQIGFYTGGGETMRLFGSGNVGVGATTDNGYKLDIAGQLRVQSSITGNGSGLTNIPFAAGIASKPTTLAGYGITDGVNAATIDSANIGYVNRARTVSGAWNFTTNPTYQGAAIVNVSGAQTLTNKTLTAPTIVGGGITGNLSIGSFSIYPVTTNTAGIGSSANFFANLYATRQFFNTTAYLDGATAGQILQTGHVAPSAASTYSMGNGTNFSSVWTGILATQGGLSIQKSSGSGLTFNNGAAANTYSGYFSGTGNFFAQSPGTVPTDNLAGAQFSHSITASSGLARGMTLTPSLTAAANGDALIGIDIAPTMIAGAFTGVVGYGLRSNAPVLVNSNIFTQSLFTTGNNINSIGSASSRFANAYATTYDGNAFLSQASSILGTTATAGGITFRQGSTSQYIGGFFPNTGNQFIQAPGVVPSDNGNRLQVSGSASFSGDVNVTGAINVTQNATSPAFDITPGALLTTPVSGAIEANGDKLHYTIPTGVVRKEVVLSDGMVLGQVPMSTTNGRLYGSTLFQWSTGNGFRLGIGGTPGATLSVGAQTQTSGSNPTVIVTTAPHTGQTAGTEIVDFRVNQAGALQYIGGTNMGLQRFFSVDSRTYSFTTPTTITNAVGAYFTAPTAGTNATFTNTYAGYFAGGVYVNGSITSAGATNTANLTATGNAVISGTTTLTGALTANGGLGTTTVTTTGVGELQSLRVNTSTNAGYGADINGTARIQGNATLGGTLNLNGAAIFSNNLGVNGNITAGLKFLSTGSWDNGSGQIYLGAAGASGAMTFMRGSDGGAAASIGYTSATATGDFKVETLGGNLNLNANGKIVANTTISAPIAEVNSLKVNTTVNAGYSVDVNGTFRATSDIISNTKLIGNGSFDSGFGQLQIGSLNQSGIMSFRRGSDGAATGYVGFASAASAGTDFVVQATTAAATVKVTAGTGNNIIATQTKTTLNQQLNLGTVPIYPDNTAATTGGLVVGDVYRTSTGVLMIRF